tara:strand:- start:197 stop:658 length:462 start_codon:yes stop_codon:yes gene_type:complete
MKPSQNWLSLADLSRIYGISDVHCARALRRHGLRDHLGRPTPWALEAGASAAQMSPYSPRDELWNVELCSALLEKTGYQPISRKTQVSQWAQLLEALEHGSPSINVTPAQMAEDLPSDLASEVNDQLAKLGCTFRVEDKIERKSRESELQFVH